MSKTDSYVIQHKNGVYYVHWTDGGRSKRESLGTRSALEASARHVAWSGLQTAAPASSLTVAHLWGLYVAGHAVASEASRAGMWNNLRQHFGELMPGEIDQASADAYGQKRRSGAIGRKSVDSSVRRELVALRACLSWCAKPARKLIDPSEVPTFDLPAGGPPRDRWLRTEEIARLLAAAAETSAGGRLSRVERFLWLALETAARKTAILQLTWDRVDFETGVIHYAVPGAAETKKRRASVPISRALRPVLERAHRERTGPLVLDNARNDIWPRLQMLVQRAGIGDRAAREKGGRTIRSTGIGPHTLRHTAATHMARRGVPLWLIAGVLGNSVAMVDKVYAKHAPDALAGAVNAISGGWREAAE